jgi:hypothetical protein
MLDEYVRTWLGLGTSLTDKLGRALDERNGSLRLRARPKSSARTALFDPAGKMTEPAKLSLLFAVVPGQPLAASRPEERPPD